MCTQYHSLAYLVKTAIIYYPVS